MDTMFFGLWLVISITLTCSSDSAASKLVVIMHVFSGRPDPVWEIDQGSPAYQPILTILNTHQSTPLPSRLGYHGFSLGYAPGHGVQGITIGRGSNPADELLILDTIKTLAPRGQAQPLGDSLFQSVRADIQNVQ